MRNKELIELARATAEIYKEPEFHSLRKVLNRCAGALTALESQLAADDLVPGAVLVTPDGREWPIDSSNRIDLPEKAGFFVGVRPTTLLPFQRGFTVRKEGE